jgi:hypothetical protein
MGRACDNSAGERPDDSGKGIDLIALRGQDEIEKPVKAPKYQARPARFRVGASRAAMAKAGIQPEISR